MSKKENIQKLIKALKSGEYSQGQACLRADNEHFCCLGVACDIFRKETGKGTWALEGSFEDWEFIHQRKSEGGYLPESVQKYYGFERKDPIVTIPEKIIDKYNLHPSFTYTLALLNDKSVDFTDIATIIENNYLTNEPAN